MELVRGDDDGEGVAHGSLAQTEAGRLRERGEQERLDAAEPVRRQVDGLGRRASGADRPSRARQIADEAFGRSALDAGLEMRQIAGEPEELELESERQRIEGRAAAQAGRARCRGRSGTS